MREMRGFTSFRGAPATSGSIAQLAAGIVLVGIGAWLIYSWMRPTRNTVTGVLPAWDRPPP